MDKYLIIVNKDRDENGFYEEKVLSALKSNGAEGVIFDGNLHDSYKACIVLGGDGTLIRSAVQIKDAELPVLGINTGNLGFLAGAEREDIETAIKNIVSGKITTESRMMLDVYVNDEYKASVLNDAVITRNGYSRMISLNVFINSTEVFTSNGDGIIVSTPTGSTGYNMSAGGCICVPESKAILVTPICSHSMTARAIIAAENDEIEIEVAENEHFRPTDIGLTLDGNSFLPLKEKDVVSIKKSSSSVRLIRTDNRTFYETLKSKLS